MKRKLISSIMVALLSAVLFAGCAGSNQKPTPPTEAPTKGNEATQAPSQATTQAPAQTPAQTDSETTAQEPDEKNDALYGLTISINPGVLLIAEEDANGNEIVKEVTYLNDDAKEVFSHLEGEVIGMRFQSACQYFVSEAIESGYLKEHYGVNLSLSNRWNISADVMSDLIDLKNLTQEILRETERPDAFVQMAVDVNADIPVDEPSDGRPPLYDAEGNCAMCHGALIVVCDNCHGKAYGNGRVECDLCGTSGNIACDLCEGAGTYEGETCFRCGGVGNAPCNRCDGTGMMICNRCDGDLVMLCNRCEGTNNPEIEHPEH